MAKHLEKILSTCPECGGKGIIPHRHITNKRNSKPCPECPPSVDNPRIGTGEVEKVVVVS